VLADAASFERTGVAPPPSRRVRLSSEKLHQRVEQRVEAIAIRYAAA